MMDGQWSNSLHLTDVQRGGSEFWQLSSIRSTVFFLKKEAHLDFFFTIPLLFLLTLLHELNTLLINDIPENSCGTPEVLQS